MITANVKMNLDGRPLRMKIKKTTTIQETPNVYIIQKSDGRYLGRYSQWLRSILDAKQLTFDEAQISAREDDTIYRLGNLNCVLIEEKLKQNNKIMKKVILITFIATYRHMHTPFFTTDGFNCPCPECSVK